MIKRRLNRALAVILCAAISVNCINLSVRAEEQTDTVTMDGDTYVIHSDGQNGVQQENNTDINTNTSTHTGVQLTQAELNTSTNISASRRGFNDLRNMIKNNPSSLYGGTNFFGNAGTNGTDIVTFGAMPITREQYAQYLNNVLNYRNTLVNQTRYFDTNTMPHYTLPTLDAPSFNNLNDEDKMIVNNGIVAHEKGDTNLTRIHLVGGGWIIDPRSFLNFNLFQFFQNGGVFYIGNSGGNTGGQSYNDMINAFYEAATRLGFQTQHIRTDIFNGAPRMRDAPSYSQRYAPVFDFANNEQWPITEYFYVNDVSHTSGSVSGRNTYSYAPPGDPRWGNVSNALSDQYWIGLLTDYHIDTVQKDYISNVNYTSDDRRWTILKDGQPVSEPVITDNPYHELNFTEVYNQYGPGHYDVKCEQYATFTRSIYVKYSSCDYLFDVRTGTILWYSESLVANGRGNSVNLGTEQLEDWVETGDTFSINVNDLGTVEVGESGTDRVD